MSNLLEKASIILTPTAYSDGTLHSIKPLQTFGSELVTNGDFATDSDWSKGTGWTISGGIASCDGSQSGNSNFSQSNVISDQSKTYRVEFTLSNYAAGSIKPKFGNATQGGNRTANGTYVDILSGMTNNNLTFTASPDFVGSIDNVSVKEVIDADFDFSRPTTGSATGIGSRENSSGNIESVAANLPRIDYLGGTGHILLETQSTNLYDYSQDFSQVYWNKTSATVSTSTITDPTGGQNSFKLVPDSGTGGNRSLGKSFTSLSGLHTQTVFAKKGEYNYIMLRTRNAPIAAVMFDLENGTFNVNVTSAAFDSAKIEDYGDGWFRCSMTLDPSQMTTSGQIFTSFSVGITGSETNSFNGDGTSGIYIFGAQFEELSFPTSYIPTSGSTVTRSADVCNNSGSSDLINSTEGVLYAEIAALADDGSNRIFGMSNGGDFNNSVLLRFFSVSNTIQAQVRLGGVYQCTLNYSVSDATEFNKIAFKYKQNDFSLYVNGIERATDPLGDVITGLDVLDFDVSTNNVFYGKVKCIAVFKEALTDEELTCLTT